MKSSKGNVWAETSREQGPHGRLHPLSDHQQQELEPRFGPCSPGDKGLAPNNVLMIPHQTLRGDHACTHREALQCRGGRAGLRITEAEAPIHRVLILTTESHGNPMAHCIYKAQGTAPDTRLLRF